MGNSKPSRAMRFWAWVEIIAVVQFAVVFAIAACRYVGPSAFSEEPAPYRFWTTMICALGDMHSDQPLWRQPLPILFNLSMGGLAIGVLAMFMMLPACFSSLRRARPLAWTIRICGVISVLAMFGVAAVPADPYWRLHNIFNGLAAFPGVGALLVGVIAICLANQVRRRVQFALVVYVTLCLIHLGQYVVIFIYASERNAMFPILQKVLLTMTLVFFLGLAGACGKLPAAEK